MAIDLHMFYESISHSPTAPTSRPPPVGADPSQAPTPEAQSAIPALARALANANPAAAAALLQHDRETDREEQERNRVRNLWDNLRQRLVNGRGRNPPPHLPIPVGGTAPARERSGGEHAIPDALFSELARAFNLNHPHDEMATDEPFEDQLQRVESGDMPVPEEENRPEEAPPGSFERFLIDLQVDLRTALSRGDGESEVSTGASPEASSMPTIVVDAPASPGSESDRPEPEQSTDGNASRSDAPNTPDAILDISGSAQQGAAVTNNGGDSTSAANRTESERTDNNEPNASSPVNGDGDATTSLPSPPRSTTAQAGSADQAAASSNERANAQRAGGISWWRTYRFPPMRLNARPQSASSTAATQPANPLDPNAPSVPSPPTQDTSTPSTTQSGTSATASQEQLVVPVIVVGLQSISGSRTRANGTRANAAQRTTNSVPPQAPPQLDTDAPPSTPTSAQQEGWRSRAARAFGGIGRRSASADPIENRRESAPDSGSRTFFIYVFGGETNSSLTNCILFDTFCKRILSSESSHGYWIWKLGFV